MKFKVPLTLWMMWRHLTFGRQFLSMTIVLSILGMMFGVASLIVAMAIVSGYETTLRNSIIDSFGHITLSRSEESILLNDEFKSSVIESDSSIEQMTPYLLVAGILTHSGRVKGVLMEGIEPESHQATLNLGRHLVEGRLDVSGEGAMGAVVGKGVLKAFQLRLGDEIKVVVPLGVQSGGQSLRSKVFRMRINGVLDLGRHDFDERYVLVDLNALQKLSGLEGRVTGVRLRIKNFAEANSVAQKIEAKMGLAYMTTTWWDSNRAIFKAIEYEKPVIFVIVMLITVAAVFNITASLFVSVFRRYREISILRAVGAGRWFIMGLFSLQGMWIGLMGGILGVVLGLGICELLIWVQDLVQLFPGDVYRIDRVALEVRMQDLLAIAASCVMICFLATIAPALRGARLKVVEGLRYE